MQTESKEQGTLQSKVLNEIRKTQTPCTIILTNGFQIKNALITGFDSFVLLLRTKEGGQMMVYKHAVSTISVQAQVVEEIPKNAGK